MRLLLFRIFSVGILLMGLSSNVLFAENAEMIALRNELKALKEDMAGLKDQIVMMKAKEKPGQYVPVDGTEKPGGFLKAAQSINMGGYVDAQWNQNFNDGMKNNPSNGLRSFDNRKDSFTLNQAVVYFEKPVASPGDAGFRMDLLTGEDAHTAGADGYTGDAFDLLQAYVEYMAPLSFFESSEVLPHSVDIKAGRLLTLAGVEVPMAPANWEVSRGILYGYAIPTAHTGIRANFKMWKDFFDVYFGINNGWDQAFDINSNKTLEWGLGYEPFKNVKMMHSVYLGQEGAGLTNNRFLISNVATWNATDKLSFAGEMDYGTSRGAIKYDEVPYSDGNWYGVGLHTKYQLTKKLAPYHRIEWMGDQGKTRFTDGTTGFTDDLLENSFGLEYKITDNLITRGEYRMDKSVGNKAYDGKFSQEQTLEGQVIYLI